jgi:hypothetical protein
MPTVDAPPIRANALAIAIKWYNNLVGSGINPDSALFIQSLTAHIAGEIASLEHKRPNDPVIIGRARVAATTIIAAKAGSDFPGGGIVNAIGGTVAEGAGTVKDIVKAPLTIAEFLARLADVHVWIRVGEVTGGAVLIVIGVRMLAQQSGINIPVPRLPKVG